jgi:YaiO family outer membrane protein
MGLATQIALADTSGIQALGVNLYQQHVPANLITLLNQKYQQKKYNEYLTIVDEALQKDPNNPTLLYRKAGILTDLEKYDQAMIVLERLQTLQPNNAEANKLRGIVIKAQPHNEIGFDQDEAYVSDLQTYWSYSSLHYYRFTADGNVGGRINYAHRYGTTGEQYQVEAYPKISQNIYLALTYALANHTQYLFPTNQSLVEAYFNNLPHNMDASLGARYLRSLGVDIYTYTGSLGKYIYNNYIWFRPYHYTPQATDFYEIGIRHYFQDKNNYLALRVGVGKSPDLGDLPPLNQIIIISSRGFSLSGQYALTQTLFLKGGVGYVRQLFPSGLVREITDGSLGFAWQF